MELDYKLIDDTKKFLLEKYPRFGRELAQVSIEYNQNLKYHTAATDGKKVYIDPEYLKSLNEDERIFLLAHELMHIKFAHPFRLLRLDGKRKDPEIWNEVTDAIINANLKRDGFKIKEGYVNREDALEYSAEELYDLEEEKKKQENTGNNPPQEQEYSLDDHTLWEEAFEKYQKKQESKIQEKQQKDFNEKEEFSKNREERKKKLKKELEEMKREVLKNFTDKRNMQKKELGYVGVAKEPMNWETLLRREVEKSETVWSQRRSIAENNYAYRLEENDLLDEAETEVMIDISGSVNLKLVKAFLRIVKTILNYSKLKVGCFNANFWGMKNIQSIQDIDHFTILEEARADRFAYTEDWDLAVRSFSKKKEVNKIVFTDGYPGPGNMPKPDLKGENVIWIVYGNKNFSPCCGKVIHITKDQLKQLNSINISTENRHK